MERRGIQTEVVSRATEEVAESRRIVELRVRDLRGLSREIARVESQLIDLTTTLGQARAERRTSYDPDEVSRQAIANWRAVRAKVLAEEQQSPRVDPFQQWLAWRKECSDPRGTGGALSFEEWQRRESARLADPRGGEALQIEQTMTQERDARRQREIDMDRDLADDFGLS